MFNIFLFPRFSLLLMSSLLSTGLPGEVDPPVQPCAGSMIIHDG